MIPLSRVLLYFVERPVDRWFNGDHKWRMPVRRMLRGPDPIGGIKRVFLNLCLGLDRLGVSYHTNLPFSEIRQDDLVGFIGRGVDCLQGYDKPNPILAGVAVGEHPQQWPALFDEFPVSRYVVHSDWVKKMYERHYGPRVVTWAVGIDTDHWTPTKNAYKDLDFLVYDKVMWDHDRVHGALVTPIMKTLKTRGLTTDTIRYGYYEPHDFRALLSRARAMLFLCEHETQGLAYQEAMSCGVPVFAWDPGQWLDPWRFRYGEGHVAATSVPFFDKRCGATFEHALDFEKKLDRFIELLNGKNFAPREYVLENLTLSGCAEKYICMLNSYCAL